ncbi:site-specific integrase [Pseudonocardia xishanensis]|uniref:Site-specific integrase n=1 Tax=Pseudonocardia xishanensis TaxID=630995 RepID=A0ABP8S3K4_9PSEU
MGRPAMPLGTYGNIRTYTRNGQCYARTLYRDWDGVTRDVQKHGATESAAKRALTEALRDRVRIDGNAVITPDSRVDVLAEAWWAEVNNEDKSPGTLRSYRDRLDRQVLPSLGKLRVRELTTGAVDRHLKAVRERHGAAVAKLVRTVLSGMCGVALRHDALDRNPVRDAPRITGGKPKKDPTALTAPQARQLRNLLTYDDTARRRDVPDLVSAMFATGLRIGEVCALRWDDVDLDTGTVRTGGMVVRERGKGLRIRREASSKVKVRGLRLPTWAVTMLRRRQEANPAGELVFPAASGGLRDPSNTQADLKDALGAAGYEWVTSHVFRKTVASLMDEAGLSSRAAADQLGHAKPSMTSDRYFGRNLVDTGAADVLEDLE